MTGTNHDPDVDQLLHDDGAQWRASLPPSADPYLTLERRATRARVVSPAALLASFAGVLAVLAVGVLVVISLPPRDQGFAAATASPATTASSVAPTTGQPVASPTAPPTAPLVRYTNGIAVEINGERVYHGDDITARKSQPGSFLVAGTLATVIYDCMAGHCPASTVWVLADPSNTSESEVLLVPGGVWVPVDVPTWPGNVVVLRVRAYDAACPWAEFCAGTLLVESAVDVPTPNPTPVTSPPPPATVALPTPQWTPPTEDTDYTVSIAPGIQPRWNAQAASDAALHILVVSAGGGPGLAPIDITALSATGPER